MALAVTVESCTDSGLCEGNAMTDYREMLVLGDNSNHETHSIALRILRRLHHVALGVDGIYYKGDNTLVLTFQWIDL